jgi:hypothetical protein
MSSPRDQWSELSLCHSTLFALHYYIALFRFDCRLFPFVRLLSLAVMFEEIVNAFAPLFAVEGYGIDIRTFNFRTDATHVQKIEMVNGVYTKAITMDMLNSDCFPRCLYDFTIDGTMDLVTFYSRAFVKLMPAPYAERVNARTSFARVMEATHLAKRDNLTSWIAVFTRISAVPHLLDRLSETQKKLISICSFTFASDFHFSSKLPENVRVSGPSYNSMGACIKYILKCESDMHAAVRMSDSDSERMYAAAQAELNVFVGPVDLRRIIFEGRWGGVFMLRMVEQYELLAGMRDLSEGEKELVVLFTRSPILNGVHQMRKPVQREMLDSEGFPGEFYDPSDSDNHADLALIIFVVYIILNAKQRFPSGLEIGGVQVVLDNVVVD